MMLRRVYLLGNLWLSARYPRKGNGRPPYLNFRHFLEKLELGHVIFSEINAYLQQQGLSFSKGSIVDASIITAPTFANQLIITQTHHLLHGAEGTLCGDAGYAGISKREELQGRELNWKIAGEVIPCYKVGQIKRSVDFPLFYI